MDNTYFIKHDKTNEMDYIHCKICGGRSYHIDDVKDKSCPYCDKTHEQLKQQMEANNGSV
jgi:ribosomal protein L37E